MTCRESWCEASYLQRPRFGMDSRRLIQRCTKPDAKEFKKIAVACAIGFSIMGFIGYTVKLLGVEADMWPLNSLLLVESMYYDVTYCYMQCWGVVQIDKLVEKSWNWNIFQQMGSLFPLAFDEPPKAGFHSYQQHHRGRQLRRDRYVARTGVQATRASGREEHGSDAPKECALESGSC